MGKDARMTPKLVPVQLTEAIFDLFDESVYAALAVRGVTQAEVLLSPHRALFLFPALGRWFKHPAFDRSAISDNPALVIDLDEQARVAFAAQGIKC